MHTNVLTSYEGIKSNRRVKLLVIFLVISIIAAQFVTFPSSTTRVAAADASYDISNPMNYCVFTFGDLTDDPNSWEGQHATGAIAVGGTLTIGNYSLTDSKYVQPGVIGLPQIVANSIVLSGGINNSRGNIIVPSESSITYGSSSIDFDAPAITGIPNYGVQYSNPLPIDFNAIKTEMIALSNKIDDYAQTSANGTVTGLGTSEFTLTGTNSDVNVFNINYDECIAAGKLLNKVWIDVPDGSSVIINVTGTTINSFPQTSMKINETYQNYAGDAVTNYDERIIWNFSEATSINMQAYGSPVSSRGTILAPNAAITKSGGNSNGSFVCESFYGSSEFHWCPPEVSFSFLPTPTPTEEPTPSITEEPTPSITEEPTPSITEEPTPSITEEPTPSITEEPTPSITEEPTPSITEEPTPSITEEPTPSITEEPTPSITEEPTPSITEAPTPTPTRATIRLWKEFEGDASSIYQDVIFAIYSSPDAESAIGMASVKKVNDQYCVTFDPNEYSGDTFYIKEISTPNDYVSSSTVYTVTFDEDGSVIYQIGSGTQASSEPIVNNKLKPVTPTEEPTPSITEEPTPSITEEPTPSITEEPTPSITEEPTPSITEEPTPSITEEPTPSITEEPTPSITEEPTPSITEEPTPSITEEPTPSITEEPTPTEEPTATPTRATIRFWKQFEGDASSIYQNVTFAIYSSPDAVLAIDTASVKKVNDQYCVTFDPNEYSGDTFYIKELLTPDDYVSSSTVYTVTFDEDGSVIYQIGSGTQASSEPIVINKLMPVTPTGEPTPSITEEPTPSITEEPTPSITEEPTPSITEEPTPSITEEPTPSITEEPTPSITEEPTPSITEEPTPSITEEPTPSITEEPTPSITEEPTPSITEEPTPSITEDPTQTEVPTPTEEPTPTGVLGITQPPTEPPTSSEVTTSPPITTTTSTTTTTTTTTTTVTKTGDVETMITALAALFFITATTLTVIAVKRRDVADEPDA